jgi:carboxyl-terminal processing protease
MNRITFRPFQGWLLILILMAGAFTVNGQSQKYDPNAGMKKYNMALQIIKYAYVDSVDEANLVETAIVENLKELDPHSVYIPKKDLKRANEPLEGNFEGVGIQFEILKDTITVVHPTPGGPSEKLGIMSGDKIIRIDGEAVTGKHITNQFVLDHLRGKRGTKVTVSIYRKGKKDLIDYTITRDKIPINSIDAAYIVEPGTGYINLNRFSQSTTQEFDEAVTKLKGQGMQNLILDLRNNAGGYMAPAIELSDNFLPSGKLIVYTEGLKSPREDFTSSGRGSFESGRLIIMINENSASSSEIVSGAVQDWDRGIIVGRRSFGKGLVQRPFMLPDSSQIRLTTARYHTPSGRCIQKPYTEGVDKYYEDFSNRVKKGELIHPDSIKFPDSLRYYTGHKRIVYGGGGIMPDVFIPWDSTPITDYYLDIRRNNIVNLTVGEFVDKNRKSLQKQYPDFASFEKGFVVDENIMKVFFDAADSAKVKFDEKGYADAEKLIKTQIKGLIAQKLWDMVAYYAIFNTYDPEVQKAVAVMKDDNIFKSLENVK